MSVKFKEGDIIKRKEFKDPSGQLFHVPIGGCVIEVNTNVYSIDWEANGILSAEFASSIDAMYELDKGRMRNDTLKILLK